MQYLIGEIVSDKEVSVCVVTCLVYVHNSQDSTSTLLTTSVTSSRHTGLMVNGGIIGVVRMSSSEFRGCG